MRTLKNAFASGRVAHAFLLSGIRGVGKTTTARIIARGLNCTGVEGPTPEPCGQCASCRAIDEDRSLDVIEMDAASQTGKDDVVDLLEGISFVPTSSRYKVYILDEVHMLSTAASNALLKTLEEPPEHVTFVLATTDPQRVLPTIRSRCQNFEFGLIPGDGPREPIFVDEVLTPDSSRYWPMDGYAPGGPQPSFDKQFVRDWLDASGWDKAGPPPPLPDDVVARTREKYIQAYEILIGQPFPWK